MSVVMSVRTCSLQRLFVRGRSPRHGSLRRTRGLDVSAFALFPLAALSLLAFFVVFATLLRLTPLLALRLARFPTTNSSLFLLVLHALRGDKP